MWISVGEKGIKLGGRGETVQSCRGKKRKVYKNKRLQFRPFIMPIYIYICANHFHNSLPLVITIVCGNFLFFFNISSIIKLITSFFPFHTHSILPVVVFFFF